MLGLLLMAVADALSALAGTGSWNCWPSLRFLSGLGSGMAYGAVMGSYACWREPDRAYGFFMAMQFGVSAVGPVPVASVAAGTGQYADCFWVLRYWTCWPWHSCCNWPAAAERARHLAPGGIEWRLVLSFTALACLLGLGLFETANMAQFTYIERIGVAHGLVAGQIGLALGVGRH